MIKTNHQLQPDFALDENEFDTTALWYYGGQIRMMLIY